MFFNRSRTTTQTFYPNFMLSVLIFYSSHFQLTVAPSGELDRWGRAGVLPLSRRVLLCLERSRPHWPERPGFVSSKRPKQSSAGEPRGIGWGRQNHGRWLVFVNPMPFFEWIIHQWIIKPYYIYINPIELWGLRKNQAILGDGFVRPTSDFGCCTLWYERMLSNTDVQHKYQECHWWYLIKTDLHSL